MSMSENGAITAGIDIGSTYTKALLMDREGNILGRAMHPTGFKLAAAAADTLELALAEAGLAREQVAYTITTGYGRHRADLADARVTDLTAAARGSKHLYPSTGTVLDIGGQTMKASRLDGKAKVRSFRLNDKCAAGTGAFLEKTARYMGYTTREIGPLAATSKEEVPISGVCAVFAESEVINQLSLGAAPADIMQGAMDSLMGRSLQLMKRVRMEPEYTLVGGILRFETTARIMREKLEGKGGVNVPDGDMPQYMAALGAALLGHQRLAKLAA